MDPLTELAIRYSTDKWGVHAYTPYYYELFAGKRVTSVLEIGILEGASLYMWRDFFPEAQIWGMDIDPKRVFHTGRIHGLICDQKNSFGMEIAGDTYGPWDIVIDDASHEPEDQSSTANILIPFVRPGGYYIIEDVREGNKEKVQEAIKYPARVVEFNVKMQADDRLIICER